MAGVKREHRKQRSEAPKPKRDWIKYFQQMPISDIRVRIAKLSAADQWDLQKSMENVFRSSAILVCYLSAMRSTLLATTPKEHKVALKRTQELLDAACDAINIPRQIPKPKF